MNSTNKTLILAAAFALFAGTASAQGLNSAFFTDQYLYRHSTNPAVGNDQNYFSVPALSNVNVSMHGNFGYQDVIFNNPRYGIDSEKKMTTFMNPYLSNSEALDGFSDGNNRILSDLNLTILSAGFKGFGGYNTIELNARASMGVSIDGEVFKFARNIGNKSYDLGDISARATGFAELAFGHSRDINEKLRLGAKVKLLFGIARADLEMKGLKADLTSNDTWLISGDAQANLSFGNTKFESKSKDYKEKEGSYDYVDDVDVSGGLSGFGLAVDLGAVYKLGDSWTFSAALNDLGFISWSKNQQARNISQQVEFNGFHDLSIHGKGEDVMYRQGQSYEDQFAEFAHLQDEGNQGRRTTGIGATLNVGASYNLPAYEKMTFGLLSSTRINGAYSWTEARVSANWTPLNWLDGGVNLAFNSFTTSLGWVLNVHPKGFNFFLGMDHLLGKQSAEGIPLSSNASVNMGMNITF